MFEFCSRVRGWAKKAGVFHYKFLTTPASLSSLVILWSVGVHLSSNFVQEKKPSPAFSVTGVTG